jgi:branched-chain amino acid transport system permease protein
MSTWGNLTLAGLTAGGMYAVFALCFVTLFRTAGILNLAVGDFAMLGALGSDYVIVQYHVALGPAIVITLVAVAVFSYLYDWVVLRTALEGRRSQEAVVVIFFFTFALSFFIEGVGRNLFGLDVRSPPALWPGPALSFDGLHLEKAGALVMILAAVCGVAFATYLKVSLRGKAMSACGQEAFAARLVGIRQPSFRRWMFVAMAVLAALFGIVISPITGFVFSTGGTLGFFGLLGAAFAAFNRPGRAVVAGIAIGLAESYLGEFSTQYQDTLLYAVLVVVILVRPQILGVNPIQYSG